MKYKASPAVRILCCAAVAALASASADILLCFVCPDVSLLEKNHPEKSTFMEYRERQSAGRGNTKKIRHSWVPLTKISPYLVKAVIIAEDDKFWDHGGFDFEAMQIALQENIRRWRFKAGGSTISQQLAKNLYLSPSKNPIRKAKEAILAWRLEKTLSKKRILELYLNYAEWGDGIFGIGAAAQHYYGKPASGLNAREASRLASVLPSPRRHTPTGDSKFVQYRSGRIYRIMVHRGVMTPEYREIMNSQEDETEEVLPGALAADSNTACPFPAAPADTPGLGAPLPVIPACESDTTGAQAPPEKEAPRDQEADSRLQNHPIGQEEAGLPTPAHPGGLRGDEPAPLRIPHSDARDRTCGPAGLPIERNRDLSSLRRHGIRARLEDAGARQTRIQHRAGSHHASAREHSHAHAAAHHAPASDHGIHEVCFRELQVHVHLLPVEIRPQGVDGSDKSVHPVLINLVGSQGCRELELLRPQSLHGLGSGFLIFLLDTHDLALLIRGQPALNHRVRAWAGRVDRHPSVGPMLRECRCGSHEHDDGSRTETDDHFPDIHRSPPLYVLSMPADRYGVTHFFHNVRPSRDSVVRAGLAGDH